MDRLATATSINLSESKTISVVTAVSRKEEQYFRLAGQSIVDLSERLADWEVTWLIAVDGIETEWVNDTLTGIDVNYQVIPESNEPSKRGPAFPRNRALRVAKSEWLLTLDADDEYIANPMAELIENARRASALWAAGLIVDIDENDDITDLGPPINLIDTVPIQGIKKFQEQFVYLPFHPCATVARTELIQRAGGWTEDPLLIRSEDTALWLRINERYAGDWLAKAVLRYRKHPASLTSQPEWLDTPKRPDLLQQYAKVEF
jgi:glycosyltransferase involved in cell wall biosynthesis